MFSKNVFEVIEKANVSIENAQKEKELYIQDNIEIKKDLLMQSTIKTMEFFNELIKNLNTMPGYMDSITIDIAVERAFNDWRYCDCTVEISPYSKLAYISINNESYLLTSLDDLEIVEFDFDKNSDSNQVYVHSEERYCSIILENFKNNKYSDSDLKKVHFIIYTLLMNSKKIENTIQENIIEHSSKMAERYEEEKSIEMHSIEKMKEYILE